MTSPVFFETDVAKKLLSLLFGFGFATIIRPMCTSDYCTINRSSNVNPDTLYKNNNDCMTFDTVISQCQPNSNAVPLDNTNVDVSNFVITTSDKFLVFAIIGLLWVASKKLNLSFGLSTGIFLVSVFINMYLGPVSRINNVFPTPFNLDKTYTKNNVCFKYSQKQQVCTPQAQPIPLQL